MDDLRKKLLAIFDQEHKEYLKDLRNLLKTVEEGVPAGEKDLSEAHRWAHSLKGAARAVDLKPVMNMAYSIEKIFSLCKEGRQKINAEIAELVRTGLDTIEVYVKAVMTEKSPPDTSESLRLLGDFLENLDKATSASAPVPEALFSGLRLKGEPLLVKEEKKILSRENEKKMLRDHKLQRKLMLVFQQECEEHVSRMMNLLDKMKLSENPETMDLNDALREAHSLKGAARAVELKYIQTLAHNLESIFQNIIAGKLQLNQETRELITDSLNAINDHMDGLHLEEGQEDEVKPESGEEDPGDKALAPRDEELARLETKTEVEQLNFVKVNAGGLKDLEKSISNFLVESIRPGSLIRQAEELTRIIRGIESEWAHTSKWSPVPLHHLEKSFDLGLLGGYISFVNHEVKQISKKLVQLKKEQISINKKILYLGTELEKNIRMTRMIPVEEVSGVFRKLVREAGEDLDRKVDFVIHGTEILVDRLVLQTLKDSIMHLLQNALSHGLESVEERKALGKELKGQLFLDFFVEGNLLHVTIADDGRGIDFEKVKARAMKKGLLGKVKDEVITRERILACLFHPGFTTVSYVTQMAGRGMGLSVVLKALNFLQGEYEIETEKDRGTKVILRIPVSIQSLRVLLVKAGGQLLAIPINSIDKLSIVKRNEVKKIETRPVVFLEGKPCPLISLGYLLGEQEPAIYWKKDTACLLFLKTMSQVIPLVVDNFVKERDVIVKPLPGPVEKINLYLGGFNLPSGAAHLILNPSSLFERYTTADLSSVEIREYAQEESPPLQAARILIVDDSITTRTLEKTILEANGYEVYVGLNGEEALKILKNREVDLVITDVNMPRMDGFTLIEEMKKDNALKELPVIVVSSNEKREDKERGLTLGANAYIIKQKFEQQELLEAVRQIL